MTKRRTALTFENALSKVAGHIGWTKVSEICGQAERTVRNWSDPDTTANIRLDSALQLDIEFHKAGGEGAPFLVCYATHVDAQRLASSPGVEALVAAAAKAAKESGEAIAAALRVSRPDAETADFAIAEREIEESLEALNHSLAAVRARRKLIEEADAQRRPASRPNANEEIRAPEVAPPIAS